MRRGRIELGLTLRRRAPPFIYYLFFTMPSSRPHWPTLWAAFLLVFATTLHGLSAEDNDIKNHPVLKYFLGSWTGEGELKGKDGNVITIKEEWKGQAASANTLTIEGKHDINGDQHGFEWTVIRNAATGAFESNFRPNTNSGDTQHYEMVFSEADLRVQSTTILPDGNTKLEITETVLGKDHDQIESKITLSDGSGEVLLSGVVKHRKAKE